jgi:hypothetical protein
MARARWLAQSRRVAGSTRREPRSELVMVQTSCPILRLAFAAALSLPLLACSEDKRPAAASGECSGPMTQQTEACNQYLERDKERRVR